MLALQAYTTLRLVRCRAFNRVQKAGQAKLVWLLPLIGAAFVLVMVLEEDRHAGQWSAAATTATPGSAGNGAAGKTVSL